MNNFSNTNIALSFSYSSESKLDTVAMTVTDENRPWNKNIPSSYSNDNVSSYFDSPDCDTTAEKKIRIESCSRPTKTARKHRNSSFLNRMRLGKGGQKDNSVVGNNDSTVSSEPPLSFSSTSSFDKRDIVKVKKQPEHYRKKSKDGQCYQDRHSKNVYPKSKSDENKSPVKGIKRFMRKKNHVASSSSSSSHGFENQESDKHDKDKKINSGKIEVDESARIHFDVTNSSPTFVVKKRKSDEGLPSSALMEDDNVQNKQILLDVSTCDYFDKDAINQLEVQRTIQFHEKDPKRLRESLSPVQIAMKSSPSSSSSSIARLAMPPVEKLALNCNENIESASTLSKSAIESKVVHGGDINSSLSSNSPMSMEPDAFSSLYQDDSDEEDDADDDFPIRQTVRGIDFGEAYKTKFVGFSSPQRSPLCNNHGEDDDDCTSDQDDESDSDQYRDGSGDDDSDASTVVNSLPPARPHKPPPGATKEEQDRFYWELCYGKASAPIMNDAHMKPPINFSASSTKVPTKSCLSAKKTPWTEIANSASKRIALKKSVEVRMVQNSDGTPGNDKGTGEQNTRNASFGSFSTPQGNDSYVGKGSSDGKKSVKFGELSAAEFESTRPTVELTPLPAERVLEEFGLERKDEESDDDSAEMHQETARNADKLAMWEDDFDSFCDDWDNNDSIISMNDDSDEEKLEAFIPRKRPSRDSIRRSRASTGSAERKRGSDDRRSSIFFSKSGGSLLEPEDLDMDAQSPLKDNQTEAPFFQITSNVERNEKGVSATSRDSLQFSSPSTISGSFIRLSHSGSENSKVTPTTEITSSSNVLRSVHSEGGASIGGITNCLNRHGDECADLIPSQLDYALKDVNSVEYRPEDLGYHQASQTRNCTLFKLGELLRGVQTNFSLDHEISSLMAIEDTVSNVVVDFIDFVQDLDMLCQQSVISSHQFGRYEVLGILEMAVTLLEEVNSSANNFDDRKLCGIIESMSLFFETSEIEDTYSFLTEIALISWLEQEVEALEAAKEWLLHILKFNRREEQRIIQALSIATAQSSAMKNMQSRGSVINNKKITVEIEEMENELQLDFKQLEIMKQESCILAWKCELERSKPQEVRLYQLLTTVLPYECALDKPPLNIRISHMDETQTLISWETADCTSEKGKRDSICTVESVERTAASMMMIPNTKRLKSKATIELAAQDFFGAMLPQEGEAFKLYSRFLDGIELQKYMKDQFQVEHEMGILTVSDTFQRINLMALDILELEKISGNNIETSYPSSLAILRLPIKISESCLVEIRFTYDLSTNRTFFSVVPTDVSVETLMGTTNTTDMMKVIQVARNTLNNSPGTNAFILNRTCSAIVESLKDGNLGSTMS